jgi:hypothetical protein
MKSRFQRFSRRAPAVTIALTIFTLLVAGHAQSSFARQSDQATFPSAEEASHALFLAVNGHNERAVAEILGAGKELVSSDDEVQDRRDREQFARKYEEMHRLVREPDGTTVLYIGAENWPFPIPLMSRNGSWRFDPDAGLKEVLYRRIGENEAKAIEDCHALVGAERQPGTHDEADSRIGALLVAAGRHKSPVPFDGYYFHILTSQGTNALGGATSGQSSGDRTTDRVAFAAYPVAYRSSGVMTFIVDHDDVVYQKDLGPNTADLARAMTKYRPDSTWTPAETER